MHPLLVALTTRSPSHAVQRLYAEHSVQLSIASPHSERTKDFVLFLSNKYNHIEI